MKPIIMKTIDLGDPKYSSLPRTERLFLVLWLKWGWISLPDENPITTFRKFTNPNELDLEFELIQIDNYLMDHAKEENHSRIWYKDSWVEGIQKWLKNTKRAKVNKKLFVSIDDMVEKDEPQEKLSKADQFHKEALGSSLRNENISLFQEIKDYIFIDYNYNQLSYIWFSASPESKYLRSRIMKAKDRLSNPEAFVGWLYKFADIPDIAATYLIDIWIGEYDIEILEDDYPPKEDQVAQEDPSPSKAIQENTTLKTSLNTTFDEDNILSISQMKEKIIEQMTRGKE